LFVMPRSASVSNMLLLCVIALVLAGAHVDVGGVDVDVGVSGRLSDYVSHFEPLHYDASAVHQEHLRHKRSTHEEGHKVKLDFFSHGRRFQLELSRDHSVFSDRLVVVRGDHTGDRDEVIDGGLDTSHIYKGNVRGA
jgi:hypothetical protein